MAQFRRLRIVYIVKALKKPVFVNYVSSHKKFSLY